MAAPELRNPPTPALEKSEEVKKRGGGVAPEYRLGKDEMNFIEKPFRRLKRESKGSPGFSSFTLEWEQVHPRTGKTVQSSWRVTGDPELGLPGPVEERLYLVLMELSREQGFPQKVMFARSRILERLGIAHTKKNYTMLRDAFSRLSAVTIHATRSFWQPQTQDLSPFTIVHILEHVDYVDELPGPRRSKEQGALWQSSFRWSNEFYASIIAGNIRSLDIEFALSLELPLSQSLYRYLDKHRTPPTALRSKFEIGVRRLCEIHLAMAKCRYPSQYIERLTPAIAELKERGFLLACDFEPMKSGPEMGQPKAVFYYANSTLLSKEEVRAQTGRGSAEEEEGEMEETGEMRDQVALLSPSSFNCSPPSTLSGGVLGTQPPMTMRVTPVVAATSPASLPFVEEDETDYSAEDEYRARLDKACDFVFERLEDTERREIEETAKRRLPSALQHWQFANSPGVLTIMSSERRHIVWKKCQDEVEEAMRNGVGEVDVAAWESEKMPLTEEEYALMESGGASEWEYSMPPELCDGRDD